MAKGYERQNSKTIANAFKRFVKNKTLVLKDGMYKLLEDAVKTALELHDEKHQSHITLGDTYGWMLVVDGKIDKIKVEAKGDKVGKATNMLKAYVNKIPREGIIGIVMAGMQPANFFSINYEKGIIENTIQITRQNFSQYFSKI